MQILYDLGIDEKEIVDMVNQYENIKELSVSEIQRKLEILKQIGCNERHIKNILISNPYYLNRMDNDIIELINRMIELKFSCLNILFDSNPYILNIDVFELDNYINNKLNQGVLLEDIVDELDSNPYLFDEI